MIPKFLGSGTSVANITLNIEESVRLAALFVIVEGTADTGKTLAEEDVGRMNLSIFNRPIVDISFEMMRLVNRDGGSVTSGASATAGAFKLSALIPFRFGDNNVLHITPDDNATFNFNFLSNYDTEVVSHTMSIIGLVENGVQLYTPIIRQISHSMAASEQRKVDVNEENIHALYLSEGVVGTAVNLGSGNFDRFAIHHGRKSGGVSNAQAGEITNFVSGAVGAVDNTYAKIMQAAGDVSSHFNNNAALELFNGSGGASTMQIITLAKRYNSHKMSRTLKLQAEDVTAIVREKSAAGHNDAVRVLRSMHPVSTSPR